MDRFIAELTKNSENGFCIFKIQYGQIYSAIGVNSNFNMKTLKSNMDRFIVGENPMNALIDLL